VGHGREHTLLSWSAAGLRARKCQRVIYWCWDPPCPCRLQAAWLSLPAPPTRASWGGEEKAGSRQACRGVRAFFNLFHSVVSFLVSDVTLQKPEGHRHIPTSPPVFAASPGGRVRGVPANPTGAPSAPSLCPPAGAALPAVRGDLPGVWPRPGEKLATLQGVHPAGAGQASGEYTAPRAGEKTP